MRTWNDYKEHVNAVDPEISKDLKEAEEVAAIVTAMIEQRTALGLESHGDRFRDSQKILLCGCGAMITT